tara:strand:+ start:302 stop:412 length:111 start_codon:yes stop_codon:yes gene_type:complete
MEKEVVEGFDLLANAKQKEEVCLWFEIIMIIGTKKQ